MLFLAGGPGNLVPTGSGASGFTRGLRPFVEDHPIYLATRKLGLRESYTTRDIADDYAELIRADFAGHVDLIIGMSFGGLIAQHLAADHGSVFDHFWTTVWSKTCANSRAASADD